MNDSGWDQIDDAFPYPLSCERHWPASAMCLYPIFDWIGRNSLAEIASREFVKENKVLKGTNKLLFVNITKLLEISV